MAKDLKTRKTIEVDGHPTLDEDEPVMVLRARDPIARAAVRCYAETVKAVRKASPKAFDKSFVDACFEADREFHAWGKKDSRLPD